MAASYQKTSDNKYIAFANKLLYDDDDLSRLAVPPYVYNFYNSTEGKTEQTRTNYLRDVIFFIKYLMRINPDFRETELKDFPVEVISSLSSSDIEDYRKMLIGKYANNKKIESDSMPSSARTKMAAVICFLNYLSESVNSGIKNIIPSGALGTAKKKGKEFSKLSDDQIERLISGVRANDYFLTEDGAKIPIKGRALVKREHLVIRNIAILQLIVSMDIRISELVALDVSDVYLSSGKLKVGDDYKDLSPAAAEALNEYLSGPVSPTPSSFSVLSEYADFAKAHVWDQDEEFRKSFKKTFADADEQIYQDALAYMAKSRRHGRNGFKLSSANDALFVTFRGTRMSERMIQLMVKEYVALYVDINMDFSPKKLRNTVIRNEDIMTES